MDCTWDLINHLHPDRKARVISFYRDSGFRPEFRKLLERWIERNITLSEVMQQNAQEDKARIMILYTRFLAELENVRENRGPPESVRQLLKEGILYYQNGGPGLWYNTISACLRAEMTEILNQMGVQAPSADFRIFCLSTYVTLITRKLRLVLLDINEMTTECQWMGQQHVSELNERNKACVSGVEELTRQFETLGDKVENFMIPLRWSSHGFTELVPRLEEVEAWYQQLIRSICGFQEAVHRLHACINVADILNRVRTCHLALLRHAIVVDTQPPQIVLSGRLLPRENPVSVRFLLRLPQPKEGGEAAYPVVKLTVIDENQAKGLWPTQYLGDEIPSNSAVTVSSPVGNISKNANKVEYKFRSVKVTTVTKKEGPQSSFRKFCFLFYTDSDALGGTGRLWCCSQPFVLILHGKQEEKANAIAFWDCFHSNDRKPFQIMEHVPWGIMSPALNRIFQYLSNTTRSLSLKNLEYLGQKLLRTQPTEQSMVPATSFLVLEARNNNFWSWFCKAADLVKPDPLRPKPKPQETEPETISRSIFLNVPWNQGYITGFISRKETEEVLRTKGQVGACIFRFSDSVPGAISFSYLRGAGGVNHVAPFTKDALLTRSMAERLDNELQEYENTSICYEDNARPDWFNIIALNGIFTKMPENIRVPEGYTPPRVFMTVSSRPASIAGSALDENSQVDGVGDNNAGMAFGENSLEDLWNGNDDVQPMEVHQLYPPQLDMMYDNYDPLCDFAGNANWTWWD